MVGQARRAGDRGQAAVEVALTLPVLVVLVLALLQVGLVVRAQVLVTHAAREAARAAAVDSDQGAAEAAARAGSGLDPDRLSVEVTGRGRPGSRVRVVVRYRLVPAVPLVGELIGDVELEAAAAMRVE